MVNNNEENESSGSSSSIISLIIIIAVAYFIIKALFFKDSWRLMVCSSLMENGIECRENSYILDGYKSQNECMEKGIAVASRQGFECGKNCKKSEYSDLAVCEEICNKAGCSK